MIASGAKIEKLSDGELNVTGGAGITPKVKKALMALAGIAAVTGTAKLVTSSMKSDKKDEGDDNSIKIEMSDAGK